MDYIKKLFNIQELGERRLEQLEKEQNLDKNLLTAYQHCPNLVFNYLMKTRELNRKFSREIYNSSIFEYSDKLSKNLDIIDSAYTKYRIGHYTNCPDKICQQLPELIKEIDKFL
jgi:hypothetical protein